MKNRAARSAELSMVSNSQNKCAAVESVMHNELLLASVFSYIDNPSDRRTISEVCKAWYAVDSDTRKHVYVAFTYSVEPSRLTRRFKNLTSLKLKGKPRAYEFDLLPDNWGGFVKPWMKQIVGNYAKLSSLHLRRMEVCNDDLLMLANGLSNSLQCLKLDYCSGFSTKGLLPVTRLCKSLNVLDLENSVIEDEGGEWLHELAMHNTKLEILDFAMANGLEHIDVEDVKAIVDKCKNLTSLKFSPVNRNNNLLKALSKSLSLRQLSIFFFNNNNNNIIINNINIDDNDDDEEDDEFQHNDIDIQLPPNLNSICGDIPLCSYASIAHKLIKLDLMTTTSLSKEEHHILISSCPNLQNLQVRTIIGDEGVAVVANSCRELRKIRIEEQGDQVLVSQRGLISLANACVKLEKLAIYVSDISNEALAAVGSSCKELVDFRLIVIEGDGGGDVAVDDGFLALMQGCRKLRRLCVYVRHGGLSDKGLGYIGRYGSELKALLLGCCGESDEGFVEMARGCKRLERLEMRDCPFTEDGLVMGMKMMMECCLKLMWVQGYHETGFHKFEALHRPYRNIEYFKGSTQASVQCLVYSSLAGPRTDCPLDVISPRGGHGCRWH